MRRSRTCREATRFTQCVKHLKQIGLAMHNYHSAHSTFPPAYSVSKEGKPLAGAAKTSFMKKCKEDACATKAVSKDGKPLSGAAKDSFMKKCEKDA